MALKLRTPGGDRTWLAGALIGSSIFFTGKDLYTGNGSALGWTINAILLLGGVGLWFKQQWARLGMVAVSLVAAAFQIYVLFKQGFGVKPIFFMAVMAYMAWQIWKRFSPAEIAEAEADDRPMISLVLLLREPRYLEANILANIVSSAWGADFSSGDGNEESGRFVVGETPLFAVNSPDGFFIVNNFAAPYFDNMEAVLDEVKELRLRKALEEHQAWLSVDLMRLHGDHVPEETAYKLIGKLIAELSGSDCLAILQPATSRINVWDAALEEKLRGPDVMDVFGEPTGLPVVQVADDDPRMKAAVAEARTTWPQFVEAFKKRDGENFGIKAPITANGRTEFIWVEVTGLEPEYIHGTLGNDPVDLGDLKYGSQVEVPLKDLNDWGYVRNGEPVGMFTVKVLQAIYSEEK